MLQVGRKQTADHGGGPLSGSATVRIRAGLSHCTTIGVAQMFVFGHLGFGHQLASPWRQRLPAVPLALGMLLPDIIDKPLYYARFSDVISSTRTFGHSGLLWIVFLLLGWAIGRRWPIALAVGMITHIILDFTLDLLAASDPRITWLALTWPLNGAAFGKLYIASLAEHTSRLFSGWTLAAEVLGLGLVIRDYRTARHTSAVARRTPAAKPGRP